MGNLSFPENLMIIPGHAPIVGIGGAVTSIPISLKNVQKLWAVVYIDTASTSAAVACVPQTDALVAFGSAAVLVNTVPIWCAAAAGTSDIWTRQTDAVNFTTTADALAKIVVFEIDPSSFRSTTVSTDEDCFRISLTQLDASDTAAIFYIVLPRYISKSDARTYITD
jgi:hypothetical protein